MSYAVVMPYSNVIPWSFPSAARIIDVLASPPSGFAEGRFNVEIPVRITLGKDSRDVITTKAKELLKDMKDWRALSESTDFDAVVSNAPIFFQGWEKEKT